MRLIISWALKNWTTEHGLDVSTSGCIRVRITGSCEHGNEGMNRQLSVSKKCGNFF